jgi:hypothetical protein
LATGRLFTVLTVTESATLSAYPSHNQFEHVTPGTKIEMGCPAVASDKAMALPRAETTDQRQVNGSLSSEDELPSSVTVVRTGAV